jgi:hypothetical protein
MKPRFGPNRGSIIPVRNDRGDPIGRIARDTIVNGESNTATPWVVYAGPSPSTAVDVGRFTHLADARAAAVEHFTTEAI